MSIMFRSGSVRAIRRVLAPVALLGMLLALPATAGAASQPTEPETARYEDLPSTRRLQIDLEHLDADTSWRAHAGIPEPSEPGDAAQWLDWLPAITLGRIIVWSIIGCAIAILLFILYLLIRHGRAIRLGGAAPDMPGARSTAQAGGKGVLAGESDLPLDQILAMDDLVAAIGLLQKKVLLAAATATGAILKRSDTAREALRRLPRDWDHIEIVASLVQAAERVRFAGDPIDREGLVEFADAARPILTAREAGG